MINRWLEVICDTCGNADYHHTWYHARAMGMVRKKIDDKYLHFCDDQCLDKYMEGGQS